jgi:hypothetical protein
MGWHICPSMYEIGLLFLGRLLIAWRIVVNHQKISLDVIF